MSRTPRGFNSRTLQPVELLRRKRCGMVPMAQALPHHRGYRVRKDAVPVAIYAASNAAASPLRSCSASSDGARNVHDAAWSGNVSRSNMVRTRAIQGSPR